MSGIILRLSEIRLAKQTHRPIAQAALPGGQPEVNHSIEKCPLESGPGGGQLGATGKATAQSRGMAALTAQGVDVTGIPVAYHSPLHSVITMTVNDYKKDSIK